MERGAVLEGNRPKRVVAAGVLENVVRLSEPLSERELQVACVHSGHVKLVPQHGARVHAKVREVSLDPPVDQLADEFGSALLRLEVLVEGAGI